MTKRNFYISYIKGWAIIGVLLLHLIDWSNISVSPTLKIARELLYPSVFFFIATMGSVVYIAYAHRDNLRQTTRRLITRGLQIIGVYFAYSLIKLWIFNFQTEPFYWQFSEKGILNAKEIFLLHSFTVPISIIITIGIYLLISPFFIWIVKKTKHPKTIIGSILAFALVINYLIPLPQNAITDFLYARNNIMFPVALWFVPYLIGFYLALLGFEKKALLKFGFFSILTIALHYIIGGDKFPSEHMYPLDLYYTSFSCALLYTLIGLFKVIEKFKSAHLFLAVWRFWGDHTLAIYIYHWIVIDLTLWYFYPRATVIWITGPIFVLFYTIIKQKTVKKYLAEHTNN